MKAQHNLIFGDACIDEFIGYAVFGFVPLYPNFAINDIKMNQATVPSKCISLRQSHLREPDTIDYPLKSGETWP
jgi:hypothetical protein